MAISNAWKTLGYTHQVQLRCARLGQTAPNPVLSTLRYFRDEYEAHIVREALPGAATARRCCNIAIDPEKCKGCTALRQSLPGRCHHRYGASTPHIIDATKCLKCGACMEKCKFYAISRK